MDKFAASSGAFRVTSLMFLLFYGKRRQRHGAEVCFMDRTARHQAATNLGRERFARIADRLDSYVVLSDDGIIVTAAPRLGRMKF